MTDGRLRRVFDVEMRDAVCLCHVRGERHRYYELHEEGNVLLRYVQDNRPAHVVVDLGDVEMLNSNLVGVMVRIYRSIEPYGGRLIVCGARPQAQQVLSSMRLANLWELAETVPAALEGLKASRPSETIRDERG